MGLVLVVLGRLRSDLTLGERARKLPQRLLLVRQRERRPRGGRVLDGRHGAAPGRLTSQSMVRRGAAPGQGGMIARCRDPPGARALAARRPLSEHRLVRPAAAPAWEALQLALADWRHGRTSWEQWCDATTDPRAVRGARRAPGRARRDRRERLVPRRARRDGRPGRRPVLVPDVDYSSLTWPFLAQGRRGRVAPLDRLAPRSTTPPTSSPSARSSRRRRRRRPRRAGGCGGGARRFLARRRDTRGRLAAVRREPLRRRRLCCVQVADVPARHGADDAPASALSSRQLPIAANWFAADDPLRPLLRPRATPRRRRAPPRPSPPGSRGWARSPPSVSSPTSASRRSTHTTSRSRTASAPGSSSRPATRRSSRSTSRAPRSGSRVPASARQCRGGALRASFHLYNTEDNVDAALAALAG